MSRQTALEGEIVKSYIAECPDAPSLTLARRIFRENPGLWKSVDSVRSRIRYYRGTSGERARQALVDNQFVIPAPTEDNKFSLPVPDEIEYAPYIIPETCNKMLCLGDLHVPYHDMEAIEVALQYGIDNGCDTVMLNGDVMDCLKVSRFCKDPNCRDLDGEVEMTRHLLMAIRKHAFPDAKIIYKEGNHEARIPLYGQTQAPQLWGADFIKGLDEVLELDRLGIKWVGGKRPMFFGKLNVLHGDEYGGRSGGVNPARSMYLKTKECSISWHWHRTTQYNGKTMRDVLLSCWTAGCLCDMHPEYMPQNDWNLGFAVLTREDEDNFLVDNKRILNGRAV